MWWRRLQEQHAIELTQVSRMSGEPAFPAAILASIAASGRETYNPGQNLPSGGMDLRKDFGRNPNVLPQANIYRPRG